MHSVFSRRPRVESVNNVVHNARTCAGGSTSDTPSCCLIVVNYSDIIEHSKSVVRYDYET